MGVDYTTRNILQYIAIQYGSPVENSTMVLVVLTLVIAVKGPMVFLVLSWVLFKLLDCATLTEGISTQFTSCSQL